ncbi:hypothetical protein [Rhizobium sp. 18065]|uniref:hypothetical protein n=1 Tax=Rhizobium sp. 18065 TaxID=2681411 RepID=UPI001356C089|nr:hypothetical protein [Rhizobium sp. 18065]
MNTRTKKPVELDCTTSPRRSRRPAIKAAGITTLAVTGLVAALTFGASAETPLAPRLPTTQHQAAVMAAPHGDPSASPSVSNQLVSPSDKTDGEKTGSIGGGNSSLIGEERRVLIGLLFLCFAVMVIGGYGLWRRSFRDLIQTRIGVDRP